MGKRILVAALFCMGAFGAGPALAGQEYLEVAADRVNIRTAPDTASAVVAVSRKGDLFRLLDRRGEWYRIGMFTSGARYIYHSLGRVVPYRPEVPAPASLLPEIEAALDQAEQQALEEASELRLGDVNRNIEYDRLLNDRYKLEVFHRYGLAPACYELFLEQSAGLSPP